MLLGCHEFSEVLERALATPRPKATVKVISHLLRRMDWSGTVEVTRAALSRATGLHPNTITNVLADLERLNVLVERGGDGRKLILRVNSRLATYLGEPERSARQVEDGPLVAA